MRKLLKTSKLFLFLLVLFTFIPVSQANAGGYVDYGPDANGYYWWTGPTSDGFGIFYDGECDSPTPNSYNFKIRFYVDGGYSGARVTSCTYEGAACYVPLYDGPSSAGCGLIDEGADDKISSFVVVGIKAGWDVCLYSGNGFTGNYIRLYNDTDDRTSLTTMNDAISSWRKRAEGTAC